MKSIQLVDARGGILLSVSVDARHAKAPAVPNGVRARAGGRIYAMLAVCGTRAREQRKKALFPRGGGKTQGRRRRRPQHKHQVLPVRSEGMHQMGTPSILSTSNYEWVLAVVKGVLRRRPLLMTTPLPILNSIRRLARVYTLILAQLIRGIKTCMLDSHIPTPHSSNNNNMGMGF